MTTTRRARKFARVRRWYRRTGGLALVRSALVSVVTGSAMYVSYWHIAFVAHAAGEGPDSAHTEPFMIDALLVLSSAVRAADKAKGLRPRRWATATLIAMTALTFAANGASAYLKGAPWWSVINAMVAAFALFVGTEILTTKGRRKATTAKPRTEAINRPSLVPVSAAA